MMWRRIRVLLLLACAATTVACGTDTFQCQQDGDCVSSQSAGACQPSGFCSFPDEACDSGQRYGDLAGGGLAGSCVVPDAATSTSGNTSSSSSSSMGPATGTTAPASGSTAARESTGSTADETTTTDAPAICGDRNVDPGEQCDDGNADNSDACTELCAPPACDDGIQSGGESDVDCGGSDCGSCGQGATCTSGRDCASALCIASTCVQLTACSDLPARAPSGTYTLSDVEGIASPEVYCENERAGGGWTLAMVASDDGTATWTYENRDVFTNAEAFGSPQMRHLDMKSAVASSLPMQDLLFVHSPSDDWASYEDVSDSSMSLTAFIAGYPTLTCSESVEGSFALTDGTIAVKGGLCDTRLYFNRGDLDGTVEECEAPKGSSAQNTFGPCFSRSNNAPCPFDDPDGSGFGPNQINPSHEESGLGFGRALGLNTGEPSTGENNLQLFVR